MFRLLILIIFNFLISFSGKGQATLLDSTINKVESKKLIAHLAADNMKGRFTGSEEAKTAAEFIASEFRIAGTASIPGLNGYLEPFQVNVNFKNINGFNVLSILLGKTKPGEIIVFSAHYDHVGTSSTNPYKNIGPLNKSDTIYNGANDDASGVAAVILLARYFAVLNNNERTLVFVAFSGEELGLLGSEVLSRQIQADKFKALINIEMIGRNPGKQIHPFITGPSFSNLKSLLNDDLARYDESKYGKFFFINDPYHRDQLFSRSDNWNFAKLGIPAHTIMLTSPIDTFYHTPGDEIETLDFDVLTEVIRAIALSCENIIKATSTPGRINKNKIYQ